MEALFWQEAAKYQVLALDNTVVARLIIPKPSLSAGRTVYTYSGMITGTPNGDAPSILNSSYTFKADVEVPDGGGNGMLVTQGGRFSRLRLLYPEWQALIPLELGGPEAHPLGKGQNAKSSSSLSPSTGHN